jgi:hypothetical protein
MVFLDLIVANWGLNPDTERDIFKMPMQPKPIALAPGNRIYIPSQDEDFLKYSRFFRFDTFSINEAWSNLRTIALPNMNMLDGVPSANNFDPLVSGRYAKWMSFLESEKESTRNWWLDLMNVGMVETVDKNQSSGVNFTPRGTGERVRWFPCADYVNNEKESWDWMVHAAGETEKIVVEANNHTMGVQCPQNETWMHQGDQSAITKPSEPVVIGESSNTLEIQVSSLSSGWLLVADTWYPGWQAWEDGVLVPVYPGDFLFRAIPVTQGTHVIKLAFRPLSFSVGVSISLGAILFWFAWLWRTRSRDKPKAADDSSD